MKVLWHVLSVFNLVLAVAFLPLLLVGWTARMAIMFTVAGWAMCDDFAEDGLRILRGAQVSSEKANEIFERFLSTLENETDVRAAFVVYARADEKGDVFSWSSVAVKPPFTNEALFHMAEHEIANQRAKGKH